MTGFARQDGGDAVMTWAWEAKSVNSKSLDLRVRLPSGFERLEPVIRALVPKHCARGNLQIALSIDSSARPQRAQINRALLDELVAIARDLENEDRAGPATADGLLAVRGVVEVIDEREDPDVVAARDKAVTDDLEKLLAALAEARRAEGSRLSEILVQQRDRLDELVAAARDLAALQPDRLTATLTAQLEELIAALPALPEERVAQEAALLITKADIREELDRFDSHLAAVKELLGQGGAVGRRLDFLCQELNREANTICSKSPDVALTRIGLDMKAAIEQFREQVQNIE